MDDQAFIAALEAKIRERIPGFAVRYKDESRFMKFLGVLVWIFNRRFMTDYTTTIAPVVYFPSRAWAAENPRHVWKVLAHEYVHLWDWKQGKTWFTFSYLLPQILALGALAAFGAFWNLWFLTALGCLAFAAPWPAKWRTDWELRGYTMSMAVNHWRHGNVQSWQIDGIVKNFTGFDYYRMCPNEGKIRRWLGEALLAIADGTLLQGSEAEPFRDVHELLAAQGVVKVA
jgi:hypothetical protein